MASGNITVTTANKYISGKLAWSSTTDTANNRSTVTATLYLSRTNTGYTTTRTPNITITINGNKKNIVASSQLTFKYNSNTNCGTYSVVVPHNTDGSKSCVISVSGSLTGGDGAYTINSASQTVTLNKIPRYARITSFTLSKATRDGFAVSWSSPNYISKWWYSIDGGTTWMEAGKNVYSGSTTAGSLAANTTYRVRVCVRSSASGLDTYSDIKTISTLKAAVANTPTASEWTCTQMRIGWSSQTTVTEVHYSLDGGATYASAGTFSARTSGNFLVTGLSAGAKYNIVVWVKDAVKGTWSAKSAVRSTSTWGLSTSTAPTFNTGNNLTTTFSRPVANLFHDVTLQVQADSGDYVNIKSLTNQSTSATFTLSASDLNLIYRKRINGKTTKTRLVVKCKWNSGGASQGTYHTYGTVTIVGAEPSLASVSYKDANATIQGILKNNKKILRNLSTLQVTAGQATSQKYATLKSYKVSIGGGEYTTNTSGTSETGKVINVGKINQSANQTAVLTVIDSRGYTASRSFTVQMLDYLPPQFIQASANRLNNYEESSSLYINARHSIVKPDSTDVNSLKLRYRAKQNPSGSYGSWVNITIPDGAGSGLWKNFNIDQYIADYPNNRSYTIELGISDIFTTWSTILINLPEGIALMRFFKDSIEAGVPFNSGVGIGKKNTRGSLDVLGDVYISGGLNVNEKKVVDTTHTHNGTDASKINWSNIDGTPHIIPRTHTHNGTDASKINWSNIDGIPYIMERTYSAYLSAGASKTIGDISTGVYLATTDRGPAGGAAYIIVDGVNSILKLHGAGQQGTLSYSGNSLIFKAHGGGGETVRLYKIY